MAHLRAFILLLTLIILKTSCALPQPLNARVLHAGYNPDTGAYVVLIDAGSNQGLMEGAEYLLSSGGRELGILRISGALPESAAGDFLSRVGAPPPGIGAEITLAETSSGTEPAGSEYSSPAGGRVAGSEKLAEGYKVGPGDVLKINAIPAGRLPDTVTVRPDNTLSLPYIGYLSVENMTVFQIAEAIQSLLARDFRRPWVEVAVQEYKSRTVKVIGELNTFNWRVSGAGEYPLMADTTISVFITTIGGVTKDADAKNIKIVRSGGERLTIDLTAALANPESDQNITLEPGDMIYVPRVAAGAGAVRVIALGRFSRQGLIELEPEHTQLVDLVSSAGGLAPDAALDRIFLVRAENGVQQTRQIDLSGIQNGSLGEPVTLQAGDIVYVPARAEKKTTLDRINNVLADILPSLNFIWVQKTVLK